VDPLIISRKSSPRVLRKAHRGEKVKERERAGELVELRGGGGEIYEYALRDELTICSKEEIGFSTAFCCSPLSPPL
jgi:hypothetical protein